MFTTILSTIVVLGVLIFVHELGHFLMAKWSGVTVLRFSLGFGPRIFGVRRGETQYQISAIPLGGYVKMLGEDPGEEVGEVDMSKSFASQPVSKRIAIVSAGPLSNLLLAIVIFTLVYAFAGIPHLSPEVGVVTAGSPAQQAGLREGDTVLSINGKPLSTWDELSKTIQDEGDRPLLLEVRRGGETMAVEVSAEVKEVPNIFGEPLQRPVIGIQPSGRTDLRKVNPLVAGYHSLAQTWNLTKLFLLTIVKLVQRVLPMETLGGPILIAQMAGQQAEAGILNLVFFTALISVNLAILNLLPIPILDGGHLLFFIVEAIIGRPVAVRKVELAQKVGMIILLLLMIFVFYNDIMRLIMGQSSTPMP